MLSLPLDILREIVDELVLLHDRGTLRALSLTCQAIRLPCLKHLFRSISIPRSTAGLEKAGRWRLSQRDRRDFCSLLERSPYLVACMKSIRFVMDEDDIKVSTKPSMDRMAIINILRKFDHVKEFTISWEGEEPNRLEWTTLTSGLVSLHLAILAVLTNDSLRNLTLERIDNFPLSTLAPRFCHLSGFKVVNTTFRSTSEVRTCVLPSLRVLHLRMNDKRIGATAQNPVDLAPQLSTLKLRT